MGAATKGAPFVGLVFPLIPPRRDQQVGGGGEGRGPGRACVRVPGRPRPRPFPLAAAAALQSAWTSSAAGTFVGSGLMQNSYLSHC